jgi:FkbM family methyltransferase
MSIPDWIEWLEFPHGDNRFGIHVENIKSSNDGDVAISMILATILKDVENPYCLDIGAHEGWVSLFCVKQAPTAIVEVFEPHPFNIGVLKKNIEPFPQIRLHPYAISDFDGELPFTFGSGETHSRTPSDMKLECRRIDPFMEKETIHFIKIDTEGHDLRILKTLEAYLFKIETILSEISMCWYGDTEEEAVQRALNTFQPFLEVFPHIYTISRRGKPILFGPIHKYNLESILRTWYRRHYSTDIVFSKNSKLIQTPLLSLSPIA